MMWVVPHLKDIRPTDPTKGEALYLRAWSLQDADHKAYSKLLSDVLEYLEEVSTSSDGTASECLHPRQTTGLSTCIHSPHP